mmetsp:Transcript_29453/g.85718  ORF Transcript_29453/g.85718 Transcript_29453/m.85718 type:complete len:218 (+) Transcript_29453:974-1627(+)
MIPPPRRWRVSPMPWPGWPGSALPPGRPRRRSGSASNGRGRPDDCASWRRRWGPLVRVAMLLPAAAAAAATAAAAGRPSIPPKCRTGASAAGRSSSGRRSSWSGWAEEARTPGGMAPQQRRRRGAGRLPSPSPSPSWRPRPPPGRHRGDWRPPPAAGPGAAMPSPAGRCGIPTRAGPSVPSSGGVPPASWRLPRISAAPVLQEPGPGPGPEHWRSIP